MVSILDTLQKKKTGKRDKLFLIPVISIVLSVAVFALFIWLRNQDEKPVQIDEPWSRTTSEHVGERMSEDNDSFLLYIYADWCPYCKEAMFGDSEATSGEGTLVKWEAEENPDMEVYFERAEEVENNGDDLAEFMNSLKNDHLGGEHQDRWEWVGKQYTYSTDGGGVYKISDEQVTDDATRPGVPAFIAINEGYITGYVAGGQTLTQYTKLYEQLVVDENDCYQLGKFVTNEANGCK